MKMTSYTIYLDLNPIATIEGCEAAYVCYEAAKTIAEMTGTTASLVWNDSGEVVATTDPDDEEFWTDDECGFDPYEGCYTYDC